jgi:tetratricopeptide (TPR) repeat protein
METMGNRFYNEEDFENAEKFFEDALAVQERLKLIEESDFELYQNLAQTRIKLNKRDEAIAAFQKALELKPNDEVTMYNIMVTHYKAGEALEKDSKMDEAKDKYSQGIVMGNELIRINPNKPEYWQVLGYCKRGMGDTAGAARDLKRFNDLRQQGGAK